MRILALLPPGAAESLQRHLHAEHCVRVASSVGALHAMRRADVDLVVLDPEVVDDAHAAARMREVLERWGIPVIVYTSLTPWALHAMFRLMGHTSHALVLRGYDDHSDRIREVVRRCVPSSLVMDVLEQLRPSIAALPPRIGDVVVRAFRTPEAFPTTDTLARGAGHTRRSLDRWLSQVQLRSAAAVLAGARLAHVCSDLQGGTFRLADVARRHGYPSARAMARHLRRGIGLSPSRVRFHATSPIIAGRIAAVMRLMREGPDCGARVSRGASYDPR